MKHIITILTLLLFTCFSFGQNSRSELSNSKIYLKATYFNKVNKNIGLQTRTDLKDTLISNISYRKFLTEDFTDYSQKRERNIYYETFENGFFTLLDNKLNLIHNVNYKTNKEQTATLFGKQTSIDIEFIDTRNSFPRDILIPTGKTPRKYFNKKNNEIYLILISDLKTLAVHSNGEFYIKQLFGDNYNSISDGLKNNYQASTKFEIKKGDEIQLFYRRKWYNDTTNVAEYEDKQFKNFKYVSETITDKGKSLVMEVEGYNYLSGSKDNSEQFLINLTDSGYYLGSQFVPYKNFSTELKIIDLDNEKHFSLQGVDKIEETENSLYKIIQTKSNDHYRYYILPFFPVPYIEFGNVEGIITYSKIKGIEKGKKRERTFITDKTNIRDIISKSNYEVEIQIYFTEITDVEFKINDLETEKVLGTQNAKSKIGLNTFLVKCSKLSKEKEYGIQINYSSKESSGSFSNSVKNKY